MNPGLLPHVCQGQKAAGPHVQPPGGFRRGCWGPGPTADVPPVVPFTHKSRAPDSHRLCCAPYVCALRVRMPARDREECGRDRGPGPLIGVKVRSVLQEIQVQALQPFWSPFPLHLTSALLCPGPFRAPTSLRVKARVRQLPPHPALFPSLPLLLSALLCCSSHKGLLAVALGPGTGCALCLEC